jgi:hypothetical protein
MAKVLRVESMRASSGLMLPICARTAAAPYDLNHTASEFLSRIAVSVRVRCPSVSRAANVR